MHVFRTNKMLRWAVLQLSLLLASHCAASPDPDIHDLSRLPLSKLLTMKKSLIARAVGSDGGGNETNAGSAEALPWSSHRGGGTVWIEDPPWSGGGGWHPSGGGKSKKKLQGIFHGTISILAFLAFAAYVICMVLQAFKAKKGLVMTLATTVEPETRHRGLRTTAAGPTGDELYAALRRLAEGYARYEHCSRESCP